MEFFLNSKVKTSERAQGTALKMKEMELPHAQFPSSMKQAFSKLVVNQHQNAGEIYIIQS